MSTVCDVGDPRTLSAVLSAHAERSPDQWFLHDEIGGLTWAETWSLAMGMSAAFSRCGVRHGDTVVVGLGNRREFVATWFGLATLGAIEVPVNPSLTGAGLAHVLNHSEARVAVVETCMLSALDLLAGELVSLSLVIVVGDGKPERFPTLPFADLETDSSAYFDGGVTGGDTVAVMYTSGTSGPAKGVRMPHAQHYTNARQAVDAARITTDDSVYVCLPLHHNMAQGYGVWPALLAGCSIRVASRFNRQMFWNDIRASQATVFPFVGGLLALLADSPEHDDDADNPLRVAYGVPIPPSLLEPFEHRFGVELIHGYGSTEATIPVWGGGADRVVGSAGRVIPGFEVRIVDDLDLPLPAGRIGEICVRSAEPHAMFQGYHRDAERTVTAWRNLWFHTGDSGEFDERGNLWFRGRQGDVIRRLGEFIDPGTIEEAIFAYPGVLAVAAYGVPSELAEEEVMVAIVGRAGDEISPDDVRNFVAEKLPRHAVPRFVELVDELPLTLTGKVEKYKLRERGVTELTHDALHLNGETR